MTNKTNDLILLQVTIFVRNSNRSLVVGVFFSQTCETSLENGIIRNQHSIRLKFVTNRGDNNQHIDGYLFHQIDVHI